MVCVHVSLVPVHHCRVERVNTGSVGVIERFRIHCPPTERHFLARLAAGAGADCVYASCSSVDPLSSAAAAVHIFFLVGHPPAPVGCQLWYHRCGVRVLPARRCGVCALPLLYTPVSVLFMISSSPCSSCLWHSGAPLDVRECASTLCFLVTVTWWHGCCLVHILGSGSSSESV